MNHSLVSGVKDLLFSLQTAICDLQDRLVEWLRLIKVVAVGCSDLVRVLVLLCLPGRAVPQLAIALVPTVHRVRPSVHLQFLSSAKDSCVVSRAIVWFVVDLGVVEARSSRRHPVVLGLVVLRRVEHGARAVPAASDLHRHVLLWNQRRVEPRI